VAGRGKSQARQLQEIRGRDPAVPEEDDDRGNGQASRRGWV